jgi:hypothetical protein
MWIVDYVWWDCFTAFSEGLGIFDGIFNDPNAWHEYGYRSGGSTMSMSHNGMSIHGWADNNHWAWQAYVIYQTCAGGRMRVFMVPASPSLEWNWDGNSKSWQNPPHNAQGIR